MNVPHVPAAPPGISLIRVIGRMVPAWRRTDWIAEWEGELHYAWRSAIAQRASLPRERMRLIMRCLGAIPDALLMRHQHGANDVLDLDLKYAVRSLLRRPAFGTTVVLTLALGIGATTSIFSVVRGVLLRPLPYPASEQLVMLHGEPTDGDVEKVGPSASLPDFLDIRAEAKSFSQLTAFRQASLTLTSPSTEPARIVTSVTTSNYAATFGITPVIGRFYTAEEEKPEATAVALLGHGFWMSRFGGDPGAIGKTVAIDGESVTIIGVMPPDLPLGRNSEIWRPLVPGYSDQFRGTHRYRVVGRLAPGVSIEAADREVKAIARRLEIAYPKDNFKRSARLEPLREVIVGDTRRPLLILLGAVVLVLLIACTNLASLFLVRASAREREVAVRVALGADRRRLLRHWLTESILLTTLGGLAGIAVAWAGMRALIALAPSSIPRAAEVTLDLPVLLVLLGISIGTGIVFGLIPALGFLRGGSAFESLKDGGRGSTRGAAKGLLRRGIVLAEMALATVLVVGAGLLIKSAWRLQQVDPGFNPDRVLVAQVLLPESRFKDWPDVVELHRRLDESVRGMPGVMSSSLAYEHPLGEGWTSSFSIEGRQVTPGQEPESRIRPVTPGYFRTVGIPILRGRDIAASDVASAPGVVVVNEAFARRHFPNEDAVGKRISRNAWWKNMPATYTIIGVVANEKFLGLAEGSDPATYFPHAQFPMNDMWVVVRAEGNPMSLVPMLRERVWSIDRNLPVENVATMESLLDASLAAPRFNAALMSLFAAAALLVAAIGIYGVMSYTVAQRTNEIGVRMALGASRSRVLRLIIGQGAQLALVGIAVGVVAAFALARTLTALLYDVRAHDPLIFAGVATLLAAVALSAALIPAHRASRIEPVDALRYD